MSSEQKNVTEVREEKVESFDNKVFVSVILKLSQKLNRQQLLNKTEMQGINGGIHG
jgi:hypothetical protein